MQEDRLQCRELVADQKVNDTSCCSTEGLHSQQEVNKGMGQLGVGRQAVLEKKRIDSVMDNNPTLPECILEARACTAMVLVIEHVVQHTEQGWDMVRPVHLSLGAGWQMACECLEAESHKGVKHK